MIKALVLAGDGINCEQEMAFAARKAGFETDIVHVNDLILKKFSQSDLQKTYKALFMPGGFSFGDHLGSGRVLALKLTKGLNWNLEEYSNQGGIVLGVCNGFQALIAMGAFGKKVSITHNIQNKFLNRWAGLKKTKSENVFLKNMNDMYLPIRHGEGRLLFDPSVDVCNNADFKVTLQYDEDVNGSTERIAGLTNANGRIFGLMPHPEAAVRKTQNPEWTASPETAGEEEVGMMFFRNAFKEASCL
ncbi:phosphoribosylformylglycinamidine synthase subunit PurQ [Bdellovibrio sp. HCB337]|uniref:phosphoribosylformylglycinamidine synthase subunit PurQ n=1 Tax=Bdellovibrio sp. HCB337 TaxID=3394358 RepID=UPI0039A736AD